MNRQTKRMMQRQGADKPRAPERRPVPPPQSRDRVGPTQFMTEVRGELRKVVWPTKSEVINSTVVVLIAIVFLTAAIFLFDYLSAKAVLFLFG